MTLYLNLVKISAANVDDFNFKNISSFILKRKMCINMLFTSAKFAKI